MNINPSNILVIDDEPAIRRLLQRVFHDLGHRCNTAGTLAEGLARGGGEKPDVVFLDVRLPDGNGLDALAELRERSGNPEVIIMTGFGDPDGAELAINNGAWDYLQKPPSIEQFTLALNRALQYRQQKMVKPERVPLDRQGVVGESPAIKFCLEQVAKAAPTDAGVLITGATGTGKELFAKLVHRNSLRQAAPFVIVDCASLPDNLVESVLFGHQKGAFTGADRASKGLIKQADGGTLFLDEIGELPLGTQKSLLRVLQEHCYRPVGSQSEEQSDFRLIAATNRNLDECVEDGTFREDLLFRLKTYQIKLPSLRERPGDIKDIALNCLDSLCAKYKIPPKGVSHVFFHVMEAYTWPGNIRELVNTMEMVLAEAIDQPDLFAKHLPIEIRAASARASIQITASHPEPMQPIPRESAVLPTYRNYRSQGLDGLELKYLTQLVNQCGANLQKAMDVSGLGKTRLYSLLKKHGLSLKG